jgi:hypothetical protein
MAKKLNQVYNSLQADDAFVITPSDSLNIVEDAANTQDYEFVFVKNNTNAGGLVKVTTVHGTEITIYINSGAVEPLAVKRVWANPAPPASLVGYVGHQRI